MTLPASPVSKSGAPLAGHPLQIVYVSVEDSRNVFNLDMEKLESILLHPAVRSRKVVVLSVAGAFRQGKSFLLDFILRYLDAEPEIRSSPDWIGSQDAPLQGFSWRGGSERDTTGILLWSEPFLRTLPNGEKVAILLMDTQGAFDSKSTVRDCATVFALSTMLSSIQIYNISGNVQEDHLQHLQLFTEYGRLALEKESGTPFQHLHFLVRDWPYPYEHEFGAVGGQQMIEKRLRPAPTQPEELQRIREHLLSCFKEIHGFLMPHPGFEVSTNPAFTGRIADIHPLFVKHIQEFIPSLLAEPKLVVKEINGQQIRGRDLLHYFKAYITIFQGDEVPEPKSVLQATAEANNLAALANAKELYTKEMSKICGSNCPYTDPQIVETAHTRFMETALKQFDDCRKMGGQQFSSQYREQLTTEIAALGVEYQENNNQKNVFAGTRTPLVLLGVAFADYILWGVAAFVGIGFVQTLCQLFLFSLIVAIGLWVYARFSGEYRSVGDAIDSFAEVIYKQVYLPMCEQLLHQAVSRGVSRSLGGSPSSHSRLTRQGSARGDGGMKKRD